MAKLICSSCQKSYSENDPRWRCDCGGVLDIQFTPEFDVDKLRRRPFTMWRYREAIPVLHDENIISFYEGFTPLIDIDMGGISVKAKMDHLFPSGSYKDRGASVLISKVKELGIRHVVEDSSGNAGAAIAAYCARAQIECDIYVPSLASPEKLRQIESMGARLHKVSGSRQDAAEAVLHGGEAVYYASHSWNPYFLHGTKTLAYELCEQLDWRAPDRLIVPVGNGTLLLGAFIGFTELLTAAVIDKMPKLIAVQTANCAPCAEAFHQGQDDIAVIKDRPTLAEGIAVARPVRGSQIIKAVRRTDGDFLTVTENEIKEWLHHLYYRGFYIEPTSAVVFAALSGYQKIDKKETVVTVMTGHGLKTQKHA
ncbi:threonine synthase [candidate division KSB1 bacterium]|nr:threonine synthase [candidate division KSB1 bacterium]RQW10438.1 MAG: pyridoxal-phosphate dependent enzyme [candidate division KSB1 bacterium]